MEKHKISQIIRIVTLAPIMVLLLLMILYSKRPGIFQGISNYILSVVFLTLLPIAAYPLQQYIPGFQDKGRDGQRKLAMIMAVIGYLLGIISALCFGVTKYLLMIYLTYLFSGILILLFNRVLKVRASGHACGVAGPIAILIYLLDFTAIFSIIILALVYWASLVMKRHTWSELIWGTIIPVLSLLLSITLCQGA